jgi:hypothetical protein
VPQPAVVAVPRQAGLTAVERDKTGVLSHRAARRGVSTPKEDKTGVLSYRTPRVKRPSPASEPLLVKLITDDPEVVIYWIVDGEGE